MITIYLADDVTPLDGQALTGVAAGALSTELTIHIRNEALTEAKNVLVVMRTQDPANPGVALATGVPPQDEQWGRFRVTGKDQAGDTTWNPANTSYRSLGSYAGTLIDRIPAAGAVYGQFAIRAPGTAVNAAAWTSYLITIYDEYSQPVQPGLTFVQRGILHGIGDAARSGVVFQSGDAFIPAAAAVPDNTVYVGAGMWVHQGRLYGIIGATYTLSQSDSAAAALAAGQSYWVAYSVGAGIRTGTKGLKGTTPTKPTPPAGDVLLGYVQINYDAGGTIVETADIDWQNDPDRYNPGDGGALNLEISHGQALGGGTWRYNSVKQTVPLTDATTNYVWLLATGLFEATLTDVYPEDTALPWCSVVTAAGAITTITDRRSYAGETVVLELGAAIPGSPGSVDTKVVGHERLYIDQIIYTVPTNGGGSAGLTRLDLRVNAATIYTSNATEDWRPSVAYNAAAGALTVSGLIHEVTELKQFDVLDLRSVTHPTGGTPASAKCYVICRVP